MIGMIIASTLCLAGCSEWLKPHSHSRLQPAAYEAVFQDVYAESVFGSVYGAPDQPVSPKNPLGHSGGVRPLPPLGSE